MVLLMIVEHNTNEASDCLVCASGKYQEEHGMTSCKDCPIGTIRPPASGKDEMPWDAIGKDDFISFWVQRVKMFRLFAIMTHRITRSLQSMRHYH